MTAWAQLLHFYQPPTQAHEIVQRIANESYRPLVKVLLAHPKARIAVNMNAVLTEMLERVEFLTRHQTNSINLQSVGFEQ